jgi:predicted esterase
MTGFKYPELVNGVIAVGGILPEIDKFGSVVSSKDLENAKQLKFFISRGKNDNLINKKQFVYQEKFLNENEFDVLSIEYDGGHFLTEELIDEILDWIGSKPKK